MPFFASPSLPRSLVRRAHTTLSRRVLCVGDSLTAGFYGHPFKFQPYAAELQKTLGLPVDEIGMSGWTVDEILDNVKEEQTSDAFGKSERGLLCQLEEAHYTTCIIMGGSNDLAVGRTADEIVQDLQELHALCHGRSIRTIALPIPESACTLMPQFQTVADTREECNHRMQRWAASVPHLALFVDMMRHLPYCPDSSDWHPDGLHMSEVGYARFGEHLGPLIRDFVLEGVPDDSQTT